MKNKTNISKKSYWLVLLLLLAGLLVVPFVQGQVGNGSLNLTNGILLLSPANFPEAVELQEGDSAVFSVYVNFLEMNADSDGMLPVLPPVVDNEEDDESSENDNENYLEDEDVPTVGEQPSDDDLIYDDQSEQPGDAVENVPDVEDEEYEDDANDDEYITEEIIEDSENPSFDDEDFVSDYVAGDEDDVHIEESISEDNETEQEDSEMGFFEELFSNISFGATQVYAAEFFSPRFTFMWLQDGVVREDKSGFTVDLINLHIYNAVMLIFDEVTQYDAGLWTLRVYDGFGFVESDFSLYLTVVEAVIEDDVCECKRDLDLEEDYPFCVCDYYCECEECECFVPLLMPLSAGAFIANAYPTDEDSLQLAINNAQNGYVIDLRNAGPVLTLTRPINIPAGTGTSNAILCPVHSHLYAWQVPDDCTDCGRPGGGHLFIFSSEPIRIVSPSGRRHIEAGASSYFTLSGNIVLDGRNDGGGVSYSSAFASGVNVTANLHHVHGNLFALLGGYSPTSGGTGIHFRNISYAGGAAIQGNGAFAVRYGSFFEGSGTSIRSDGSITITEADGRPQFYARDAIIAAAGNFSSLVPPSHFPIGDFTYSSNGAQGYTYFEYTVYDLNTTVFAGVNNPGNGWDGMHQFPSNLIRAGGAISFYAGALIHGGDDPVLPIDPGVTTNPNVTLEVNITGARDILGGLAELTLFDGREISIDLDRGTDSEHEEITTPIDGSNRDAEFKLTMPDVYTALDINSPLFERLFDIKLVVTGASDPNQNGTFRGADAFSHIATIGTEDVRFVLTIDVYSGLVMLDAPYLEFGTWSLAELATRNTPISLGEAYDSCKDTANFTVFNGTGDDWQIDVRAVQRNDEDLYDMLVVEGYNSFHSLNVSNPVPIWDSYDTGLSTMNTIEWSQLEYRGSDIRVNIDGTVPNIGEQQAELIWRLMPIVSP